MGDSMIRQMFMRLIYWVQGRTGCEHFYHLSATYWLTAEGDGLSLGKSKIVAVPGKVVVHLVFCGFCDHASTLNSVSKRLRGNIDLVITSPSRWHGKFDKFSLFVNAFAHKQARLVIRGLAGVNCQKKGKGETVFPDDNRVNAEVRGIVEQRKGLANVFLLDAQRAINNATNAANIFVHINVHSAYEGEWCDLHFMCMFGDELKARRKKKGGAISYVKYSHLPGTKDLYLEDYSNLYFTFAAINPHCGAKLKGTHDSAGR